ncbi:MAG: hypothetical protein O2894_12905 [Planctomycetota bacterium]|nr:hypothetical protein [Planctomycetota bacterium]
MKRDGYLAAPAVRRFLGWLEPRLCTPGSLPHSYTRPRAAPWNCSCLFEAYERYEWGFKTTPPGGRLMTGTTFAKNRDALQELRGSLQRAVDSADAELFLDAAEAVLRWGGALPHNGARLRALGAEALPLFVRACRQLDPASADTARLDAVQLMNAGFTKIYSLMLPGFPIYDGRVGAALGYLVRLHCQEAGLAEVPSELRFAWGTPKQAPGGWQKNRNPSAGPLRFPMLRADARQHARCNLMAAWLLTEAAGRACFGALPPDQRLRALEAALFMVGYDLPPAEPQAW